MSDVKANYKQLGQCSVCMEKFDQGVHQPKLLSCHHSYCLDCVSLLVLSSSSVECPSCGRVTQGFDINMDYNRYVYQMKQDCTSTDNRKCPKHLKPIDLFCEECAVALCSKCITVDHYGHLVVHEDDLYNKTQEHREVSKRKREKALADITKRQLNIIHLEREKQSLNADMNQNLVYIDQTFAEITDTLAQKQQAMKQHVKTKYQLSVEAINDNISKEIFAIASLKNWRTLLDQTVSCFRPIDAAKAVNDLEMDEQLTEFANATQPSPQDISIKQITKVLPVILKGLKDAIEQLVPTSTTVFVQVVSTKTSTAIAGIMSTIQFNTNIKSSGLNVAITDPEIDVIYSTIEMTLNDTTYRVKFTPQVTGEHKCVITYLGLSVAGGEFSIMVKSNNPVMKIGTKGGAPGQLSSPVGIDLDAAGNMYVADRDNQRIQVFDSEGRYLTHWSTGGKDGNGYPCCLAVNKVTYEVLCTRFNRNTSCGKSEQFLCTKILQVYEDAYGNLKDEITYEEMKKIYGIAINSQQQVICSDLGHHAVFLLNKQYVLMRKIGCYGTEPGQFMTPTGVAIGIKDDVIVMDTCNNRVQVFDPNCSFKYQFGTKGTGKGQLQEGEFAAIDKDGRIFVSDFERNDIQVFNYKGKFQSCIHVRGDHMNRPLGLSVTDDHHVLVADFYNCCIKKYCYM